MQELTRILTQNRNVTCDLYQCLTWSQLEIELIDNFGAILCGVALKCELQQSLKHSMVRDVSLVNMRDSTIQREPFMVTLPRGMLRNSLAQELSKVAKQFFSYNGGKLTTKSKTPIKTEPIGFVTPTGQGQKTVREESYHN